MQKDIVMWLVQARSQGGFVGCGRTPLFDQPKKIVRLRVHTAWFELSAEQRIAGREDIETVFLLATSFGSGRSPERCVEKISLLSHPAVYKFDSYQIFILLLQMQRIWGNFRKLNARPNLRTLLCGLSCAALPL